jgi:hypothetical protein
MFSLPRFIFGLERRLGVIERPRVPVAFPARQLKRDAPKPSFVSSVGIDQIDAADFAVAVEHVVVLV